MNRTPIVAGNWKMNKTVQEALSFVEKTAKLLLNPEKVKVIFCPPFTALFEMESSLDGTDIALGAQNVHWEDKGAYTGEISAPMLSSIGIDYVIVGHSERRHIFGETDEWINLKLKSSLSAGIKPIFCVGETLEERRSGLVQDVLEKQIISGLIDIGSEYCQNLLVAYEPVWAIGTGENASPEQANEAHTLVRKLLNSMFDDDSSEVIPILYGGSVTPANAGDLISASGVDGFLIGGASLEPESFSDIVNLVNNKYLEN